MPISNPLAPSVFIRRNLGKAVPLVAVIILAVMLISSVVALINSIPLSIRTVYSYGKHHFGLSPRGNPMLAPKLKQDLLQNTPAPLDRVITARGASFLVRSLVGKWPFVCIAMPPDDMRYYVGRMGSTTIDGRYPEDGQPEAIIGEPLARNLGKKVGDILLNPDDKDAFSPKKVKIVGIAKGDKWFALMPYSYHTANHFPPIDFFVVFAKTDAEQRTLDTWAMKHFSGGNGEAFTYANLEKDTSTMFKTLYRILDVVIFTLVGVITVMMGMLMNIYQSQRVQEFGLLQALGYTKQTLIRRVVVESLLVIVGGWILGVIVSYGMLTVTDLVLMKPASFALDRLDPVAYRYTVPVPLMILLTSIFTIVQRLRTFDPVGVVERRLV